MIKQILNDGKSLRTSPIFSIRQNFLQTSIAKMAIRPQGTPSCPNTVVVTGDSCDFVYEINGFEMVRVSNFTL